jgi:hypothetical protein
MAISGVVYLVISWAPVRCGTKFPTYVSTNYTETRVTTSLVLGAGFTDGG